MKGYLGDFDERYPPEKRELSTRDLRQREIGEFDCLAPIITDVVVWIYKKHKIWISVDVDLIGRFRSFSRKYSSTTNNWVVVNIISLSEYYDKPEQAYEAAIKNILKDL